MKHEHHKKPVHHKAKTAAEPAVHDVAKKAAVKPKKTVRPKTSPKATATIEREPVVAPQPKPTPVPAQMPAATPVPLPTYLVAAIPAGPEPDDEQLFIMTEREHVAGVLANWRGGLLGSIFGGNPGRDDWEHYQRELDVYENVLDRYELDMVDGLVPFRIVVKNLLDEADQNIQIAIHVVDGSIVLAKKLPQRPRRPAGPQHVMEPTSYHIFSGFSRRHIRLSSQTMSAEFSKLAGGDAADLVNETLFLLVGPQTIVTYALSSANRPEESGYIAL